MPGRPAGRPAGELTAARPLGSGARPEREVGRLLAPGGRNPSERWDDPPPVGVERFFLRVVHEVDREVAGAQVAQARELRHMILHPAEHTEAIDDVVGDKIGGGVAGATVVGVVVVLAGP